jgi:acetylornithine deacetylase/succinyl-diaminopimelate desuccinylase-like protein
MLGIMRLDPVETLQQLIRTPSVNPMGRPLTEPIHGEGRLTDLLGDICQTQGWPYSHQLVHPERFNLLALIKGSPSPQDGGELIVWDVHQDTVPVDGMTVDPFGGDVRDGRVYGRGACDVKGSMAAMLAALSRLSVDAPSRRPTIVLACTVNEECGFTGARVVTRGWNNPEMSPPSSSSKEEAEMTAGAIVARLCRQRPHSAIVAEPTQFNVVVAHQGQVRWRCHTIGRAAHTSRPDAGINAIYGMAQIVRAIERYHAELTQNARSHPLCGRPSVCVSTIHGGVGINTVPDRATIEIDRRLAPDEQPQAAYEMLIRYVAEQVDVGRCQIVHDPPFMEGCGLNDMHNRPLAERVVSFVREHGRTSELVGVPFGTDAAAIAATGVPTVVFGPGSIDHAHTADEFIAVEELLLATEIFYQIACDGLR